MRTEASEVVASLQNLTDDLHSLEAKPSGPVIKVQRVATKGKQRQGKDNSVQASTP